MIAVTILGNNSAVPAHGRHPTAQIVHTNDHTFLVDCGEGTQMRLNENKVKRGKINHIFISHLHGDHYFGLIGLLNTYGLTGRQQDLHVHAPRDLEAIIRVHLDVVNTQLPYKLIFHILTGDEVIFEDERCQVSSFKVKHRIECYGFLFREKKFPRKINSRQVKKYHVPTSSFGALHRGEDFINTRGEVIGNEVLTVAATPPRSYAYCADTAYYEPLIEKLKGVHMIYYEATYLQDQQQKATDRFHSTTHDAARIALQANVGKLLLGHFSALYEDLSLFKEEACLIFANSEVAEEGVCYLV